MKIILLILANISFSAEIPSCPSLRSISRLQTELYEDILKYLPAVALRKLELTGDRLLSEKITSVQKSKVHRVLSQLTPQERIKYQELAVKELGSETPDQSHTFISIDDTRSMYGLISYGSNILLSDLATPIITDFLACIGNLTAISEKCKTWHRSSTSSPSPLIKPKELDKWKKLFETYAELDTQLAVLKHDAYCHGSCGYPQSDSEREAFVDKLADKGMSWAMEKKETTILLQNDLLKLHAFIESLATKNAPSMEECKFLSLIDGSNGYEPDISKAKKYLDTKMQSLFSQGIFTDRDNSFPRFIDFSYAVADDFIFDKDQYSPPISWAVFHKFNYLANGSEEFTPDIPQAHVFLETLITLHIDWAIYTKYRSLRQPEYGYSQDIATSDAILEEQINLGKYWAFNEKLELLPFNQKKKFIEELIARGNPHAVREKYSSLKRQNPMLANDYDYDEEAAQRLYLSVHGIKLQHTSEARNLNDEDYDLEEYHRPMEE